MIMVNYANITIMKIITPKQVNLIRVVFARPHFIQ